MQILLSLPSIHLPLRCSRRIHRPALIHPAHAYYVSAALRRRVQHARPQTLPPAFDETETPQADLNAGKSRLPRI